MLSAYLVQLDAGQQIAQIRGGLAGLLVVEDLFLISSRAAFAALAVTLGTVASFAGRTVRTAAPGPSRSLR